VCELRQLPEPSVELGRLWRGVRSLVKPIQESRWVRCVKEEILNGWSMAE
jgi:hypothetical protein